MKSVF